MKLTTLSLALAFVEAAKMKQAHRMASKLMNALALE